MNKTILISAILLLCLTPTGNSVAGDSRDLNDNPKMTLFPKTSFRWELNKIEAEELRSHIHILRLLRNDPTEEAIQILEAELLENGTQLQYKLERSKPRDDYEKRLRNDIDAIIEDFETYQRTYGLD